MSDYQKTVLSAIAAILTTLHETGGGPESSCYLALGADMALWEVVKAILAGKGWVTFRNHWAELTDAGRVKAEQINAAIAR